MLGLVLLVPYFVWMLGQSLADLPVAQRIASVVLRAAFLAVLAFGLARVAQLREQVAAGLTTTFASSYTAQVSLQGALSLEAIADYGRQATGSKYVIIPSPADHF